MAKLDKEDLTIVMSQGDFLDLTYDLRHIVLTEYGELFFTVKENIDDKEPLIVKEFNAFDCRSRKARLVMTSEETSVLTAGSYFYDIVYIVGKNKLTVNYPAKIIVREVIHNA